MATKTYQVEVWRRGALMFRTEETDSVNRAHGIAAYLHDVMGPTHTVFILLDNKQYASYEWHSLT